MKVKSIYYCIIVSLFALFFLIIFYESIYQKVFATTTSSPSFSRQEIDDRKSDWLDVWRGRNTVIGAKYTDIQVVNYYSDGRFLNATLWLDKFNEIGPPDRKLNYGMYIDADFNNKTGIAGIDYKVEIQWDNKTKSWTRVFEEWSTNGKAKTLDIKPNYTGFFEKSSGGNNTRGSEEGEGGDYVTLYADLNKMFSPTRYKVLFYSEEVKGLKWIMDSSKWIYIPPPEFVITTLPQSVDLRQGDSRTIEVQVNSTKGFEPSFQLYAVYPSSSTSTSSSFPYQQQQQQPLKQQQYAYKVPITASAASADNNNNDIKLDFRLNNLRIPSQGEATAPVTISSIPNALLSPHTLFIVGNFTFPSEEFFAQPLLSTSEKIKIPAENVITQSSLTVRLQEALTPVDQISEFWSKLGGFINFIYVIGGALATWLFSSYIKKKRSKQDNGKKEY
jgi:hypothetical protein